MDEDENDGLFSGPDPLDALLECDINGPKDKLNELKTTYDSYQLGGCKTAPVEVFPVKNSLPNVYCADSSIDDVAFETVTVNSDNDAFNNKIYPYHYTGPYIKEMKIKTSKKKRFRCTIDNCNRLFLLEASYKRHLLLHEITHFKCKYCKKVLPDKNILAEHESKHYGEDGKLRLFQCFTSDCCKVFMSLNSLERHELRNHVHLSEPYRCDKCHKCFSFHHLYTRHLSTHNNARNHGCMECGKCFKSKNELDLHARLHSNRQAFACEQCGREFYTSYNLKRHESVHKSRNFSCHICCVNFNYARSLTWHMIEHHPIARSKELKSIRDKKRNKNKDILQIN